MRIPATRADIGPTIRHRAGSSRRPAKARAASRLVCAAAALVSLGGCASTSAEVKQAASLTATVERLRTENAVYARRVEELENRVFILSSHLEERRRNAPAAPAAPALPRVTLRKDDAPPVPEPPAKTLVADDEIEYVGEAARPTANRPLLRLYGNGTSQAPSSPPMTIEGEGAVPERRRVGGAEAVTLYNEALEHLRSGAHEDAVAGFRKFVAQHPEHDYADNAQYWLAECFYDRKDYARAVREFRTVVERFPQGNKVPDAWLKIGFSSLTLGDAAAGRRALDAVVSKFPGSGAAELASAKLAEIGNDHDPAPVTGKTRKEAR